MPVHHTLTTSSQAINNTSTPLNFQIRISAGTGGQRSTVAIQQAPQNNANFRDLFYFTGDGDVNYEVTIDSYMKYRVVNAVTNSTVSIYVTGS